MILAVVSILVENELIFVMIWSGLRILWHGGKVVVIYWEEEMGLPEGRGWLVLETGG